MIIILAIFILTLLIKIRYRKLADVDTYLDKDHTTSIIGIFAVIIFFSHFSGYLDHTPINALDQIAFNVTSGLGQLMVVPFMFFSGYGLFEQYKNKGINYVNKLPKSRIFKVYLMFLFAWIIFFALALILKANYTVPEYLLSIFGIVAIGNSNWYVVIILVLYFTSYLSMKLAKENKDLALIINIMLGLILIFSLIKFNAGMYWWDSIPAYLFGLVYSRYKDNFLTFYKKANWTRWCTFILSVGLTAGFGMLNFFFMNPIYYEMMVICFCMIFASFLSLFKVGNVIILTLGKYCFWIYILQRIPMLIFYKVDVITSNIYLYFFLCLVSTALLAFIMDKLFTLTWSKINNLSLKRK